MSLTVSIDSSHQVHSPCPLLVFGTEFLCLFGSPGSRSVEQTVDQSGESSIPFGFLE